MFEYTIIITGILFTYTLKMRMQWFLNILHLHKRKIFKKSHCKSKRGYLDTVFWQIFTTKVRLNIIFSKESDDELTQHTLLIFITTWISLCVEKKKMNLSFLSDRKQQYICTFLTRGFNAMRSNASAIVIL